MAWTWFKTRAPAPVPNDGLDTYKRNPLYGRFGNGHNVFGPYRRPVVDATGRGGQIIMRQLKPLEPNTVVPQQWTPVAITGAGSELTGAFSTVGLVDVTTPKNTTNSNNRVA